MARAQIQLSNPNLLRWLAAGHYITLDGQDYFYRDEGTGPMLLLVHGFPTSSWDWHRVFNTFAQRHRVIAPDMLGFGFSDKPKDGDFTTTAHAAFHARLVEALGGQDVHILTYSFGSSVVQQMLWAALSKPSHFDIRSITFLNGGLFPRSNHPNLSQRLLLSPIGPLVARSFRKATLAKSLQAIFGPDTQPSQQLVSDYWELLNLKNGRLRLPRLIGYLRDRKRHEEAWTQALIEHSADKQLIIGLKDPISGPLVADEYRRKVSDASVRVLPTIGHYPQLEAPQVVIEAVEEIVSQS